MAPIPCHICQYAKWILWQYRCKNPCTPAHPPSCISYKLEIFSYPEKSGAKALRQPPGIGRAPAARSTTGIRNSSPGDSVVTEHRHALQLGLGSRTLAGQLSAFGALALRHSRLEHRHSGKRSCGHIGTLGGSIESQDSLLTAYSWLINFRGTHPLLEVPHRCEEISTLPTPELALNQSFTVAFMLLTHLMPQTHPMQQRPFATIRSNPYKPGKLRTATPARHCPQPGKATGASQGLAPSQPTTPIFVGGIATAKVTTHAKDVGCQ